LAWRKSEAIFHSTRTIRPIGALLLRLSKIAKMEASLNVSLPLNH
jgi:hypothetical protein